MAHKQRRPTFNQMVNTLKQEKTIKAYNLFQEGNHRPSPEQALREISQFASQASGKTVIADRHIDYALAKALSTGTPFDWQEVRKAYQERHKATGHFHIKHVDDVTTTLAMAAAMPSITGTAQGLPYLRTVRVLPVYASLQSLAPSLDQHLREHYRHEAKYYPIGDKKNQNNNGTRGLL